MTGKIEPQLARFIFNHWDHFPLPTITANIRFIKHLNVSDFAEELVKSSALMNRATADQEMNILRQPLLKAANQRLSSLLRALGFTSAVTAGEVSIF